MRRCLVPIASGFLMTVAVVAGCSSSPKSSAPTTTVATAAPTTIASPTTTQPTKATGGAPTSADAVTGLIEAWRTKDQVAAAKIADPIAIMGIFAVPGSDMNKRGCTTDDSVPEGGCVYWAGDGLIQINTQHRENGWVVTSAVYDPLVDGNETSGNAPDAPPPTTMPPATTLPPESVTPPVN